MKHEPLHPAEAERRAMADRHTLCLEAVRRHETWPEVGLAVEDTVPLGWLWRLDGGGARPDEGFLSRVDVGLFLRPQDGLVAPGLLVRPCLEPRFKDDEDLSKEYRRWRTDLKKAGDSGRVVGGAVDAPELSKLIHLPTAPWPLRRPVPLAEACSALSEALKAPSELLALRPDQVGREPKAFKEVPHLADGLRSRHAGGFQVWDRQVPLPRGRGAPRSWTPEPLACQLSAHLPDGRQTRYWGEPPCAARSQLGRHMSIGFGLHALAAHGRDTLVAPERIHWRDLSTATAVSLQSLAEEEEVRQAESRRRRKGTAEKLRHIGPWVVISGADVVPPSSKLKPSRLYRLLVEWIRTPGFCETLRVVCQGRPSAVRFFGGASWPQFLVHRHRWFVACDVVVPTREPSWSAAAAVGDARPSGDAVVRLAAFVSPPTVEKGIAGQLANRLRDEMLGPDVGEVADVWLCRPSGVSWVVSTSQLGGASVAE